MYAPAKLVLVAAFVAASATSAVAAWKPMSHEQKISEAAGRCADGGSKDVKVCAVKWVQCVDDVAGGTNATLNICDEQLGLRFE